MHHRFTLAVAASVLAAAAVHAAEPPLLDVKPVKVSLFKNGLAIVDARALAPAAGEYRVDRFPEATWGSLWLTTGPGVELQTATSREATFLQAATAEEVEAALEAQLGPTVTVADAAGAGVMREVTAPVLDLTLGGEGVEDGGLAVGMAWITRGAAWAPSVLVDVLDDETARFTAKAVVINDAMDLDGVDLELIAGFPNLSFANAPTPMSLDPLPQLLAALDARSTQPGRDVTLNQMVMYNRMAPGAAESFGGGMSLPPAETAGEDAGELYFFQLPAVTLKRGERGYFPLLSLEVPCHSIHTWEVAASVDPYGRPQNNSGNDDEPEPVWRELELENTGDQPWTTSPATTRRDGRPLGQDTLAYTPPGATGRLKVTRAAGVEARATEVEVNREEDPQRFMGDRYWRVTVEGTLTATNHQREAIDLRVTQRLSGTVDTAGQDAKVDRPVRDRRGPNPSSRIQWSSELPAGETAEFTYRYSYLSR